MVDQHPVLDTYQDQQMNKYHYHLFLMYIDMNLYILVLDLNKFDKNLYLSQDPDPKIHLFILISFQNISKINFYHDFLLYQAMSYILLHLFELKHFYKFSILVHIVQIEMFDHDYVLNHLNQFSFY
jgi:hypothetical protein